MSAASTKHRLKGMDYNIDGFVSQLFDSGRFVELIDKLSEEAANRIKYNKNKKSFIVSTDIHEAPVYNEKGTKRRSKGEQYDIDGIISQVLVSKNVHELLTKLTVNAASKIMRFDANSAFRIGTENSYENPPKNNHVKDAKTREEFPGKVDIQAIINQMVSLSENLKLEYGNDESDSTTKLLSKEKTTESVIKDHIRKTVGSTSKNNVTETNKNDSKKKTIDLNKRTLDYAKGHYGKAAPNRHNESSHSGHNGTDGEDQENSKKIYKSLEEQSSSQEHINSREAQNSELKVKDVLKQKTSYMDKSIREEENLSSSDEENHSPSPSKEKTNRKVAETKEETENRSTENIVVNLGDEDSVMNNKMVSDDNPYGEDRGSPERPQERTVEDQRLKEQSDERQIKPIIRKEGSKLYTYVQAADYEEYHEKLAKWRKTHPENATDFIK